VAIARLFLFPFYRLCEQYASQGLRLLFFFCFFFFFFFFFFFSGKLDWENPQAALEIFAAYSRELPVLPWAFATNNSNRLSSQCTCQAPFWLMLKVFCDFKHMGFSAKHPGLFLQAIVEKNSSRKKMSRQRLRWTAPYYQNISDSELNLPPNWKTFSWLNLFILTIINSLLQ